MKLIIGRHGEAESIAMTGLDKDRRLTEKGRLDIAKMGGYILQTPLKVTQIYYSPYARTNETATIFSETLHFSGDPIPASELLPGNEYSDLFPKLSKLSNSDTVLIVGHNPDVSYLVSKLIRDVSISRSFIFMPGTTIAINIAKENFQNGQLLWMISPEFLKS